MRSCLTELLQTRYHNYEIRFTDGSKAGGRVGFGVTDGQTSHFWRLPDQCSVFSAETAALHYAASLPSSSPLCVLTDSASALAALESATARHLWIQAIQNHTPPGTTFMWIPGHCGITGNTEADHLAAIGRNGRLANTSVPRQDLKSWIKSTLRTAWDREWFARRDLFIRKTKGVTLPWTDVPRFNDQRFLSRLRSGHTRITHNMGSSSGRNFRQRCDTCLTIMTVEHILINCPCFHGPRELYGIPGNIRDALQNDPVAEAQLICFAKEAGIYKRV
ncbi:uncharacterized protein LOC135705270 [Ochlerotatus camptorhynchus]|uniref:uncharacterized protein LOC135705270 n=1 Tax=Ochlerotatus camptorhynchus TaxID=644619 RepID=UPI0031DB110D